jgi:small ligand-binding sensory domain FIST
MSGNELPPTFGTLLMTDVDRGRQVYSDDHEENFESKTTLSYVPAPLSGMFGGGECTDQECVC